MLQVRHAANASEQAARNQSCKASLLHAAQNLGLAVRAYRELLDMQGVSVVSGSPEPECFLVLAGGCDARLAENREHFAELQALVQELGLQQQARSVLYLRPACHPYSLCSAAVLAKADS